MQARASYSISDLPLVQGKRNLVSLGPVASSDHAWAYSLFVDAMESGLLQGSIMASSMLADHVLMNDQLAIIIPSGQEVYEGVVRIVSLHQNAQKAQILLEMSVEELSLCGPFNQAAIPRT